MSHFTFVVIQPTNSVMSWLLSISDNKCNCMLLNKGIELYLSETLGQE